MLISHSFFHALHLRHTSVGQFSVIFEARVPASVQVCKSSCVWHVLQLARKLAKCREQFRFFGEEEEELHSRACVFVVTL